MAPSVTRTPEPVTHVPPISGVLSTVRVPFAGEVIAGAWLSRQTDGLPVQAKPASTVQVPEQPSSAASPPSSHASNVSRKPSPHSPTWTWWSSTSPEYASPEDVLHVVVLSQMRRRTEAIPVVV